MALRAESASIHTWCEEADGHREASGRPPMCPGHTRSGIGTSQTTCGCAGLSTRFSPQAPGSFRLRFPTTRLPGAACADGLWTLVQLSAFPWGWDPLCHSKNHIVLFLMGPAAGRPVPGSTWTPGRLAVFLK